MDFVSLLEKLIGGASLGFVAFLANKWISAVESRFESNFQTIENRIHSSEEKIGALQAKYQDVLDIVLTKFTAWEDRLALLLAKITTTDAAQFAKELENFRRQNKDDLDVMKLEINRVKNIVEATSFESEYIARLRELETQLAGRIKGTEERLSLAIKMVGHLNEKSKQLEFRFGNLEAVNKAKGNPKA